MSFRVLHLFFSSLNYLLENLLTKSYSYPLSCLPRLHRVHTNLSLCRISVCFLFDSCAQFHQALSTETKLVLGYTGVRYILQTLISCIVAKNCISFHMFSNDKKYAFV